MIWTIVRIGYLQLKRGKIELMLTFVVPILFFSIFAMIFGGMGGDNATPKVRVVIVDEDQTDVSQRFVKALQKEPSLVNPRSSKDRADQPAITRAEAETMVRKGETTLAIIIPRGFTDSFGGFAGDGATVDVIADSSNPVGPQLVGGLMQKVAMTSVSDVFLEYGMEQFEQHGGPMTEQQRDAIETWLPMVRELMDSGPSAGDVAENGEEPDGQAVGIGGLVNVQVHDVLGEDDGKSIVSFYAAAVAVMFLLFSATGAGGALIDEEQSCTLERLLVSQLSMSQLLGGKWLFLVLMGCIQITVMFVWGQLVFDVDLVGHLPGFALMTVVTAAAASGFGLLLATACRSRGQLHGISTIIILTMSAVGGSMVPRYIMPQFMQDIGLVTFNAWALDGYQKVFWYDSALWELWPQVLVLASAALVFMAVARLLARRWETV